jgi:[acyl-carrier-protein] S-malonyltransferase
MGADLLRTDEWVREQMHRVSEWTGEDIERICLKGPERKLMRSMIVQPALCIIGLGYTRQLKACGWEPDIVAGHSMGEITALAVSGVLTPEQAVDVAVQRGVLMDAAAEQTPGGMAVVTRSLAEVEALIESLGMGNEVFVANDNAPAQVVVSGATAPLADFVLATNKAYPGCCKPLRVSGPWHTPLLEDVRANFQDWLDGIPFKPPRIPLIANATACVETDPESLRAYTAGQLVHRVCWRGTMDAVRASSAEVVLEIGPGRVLAGLARLNGLGNETLVRGINNLRAIELLNADHSAGGGK